MLISLFLLFKGYPNVAPYRDLTTVCDISKAFGFIFATNGRLYILTVLVATSNKFERQDL